MSTHGISLESRARPFGGRASLRDGFRLAIRQVKGRHQILVIRRTRGTGERIDRHIRWLGTEQA